MNERGKFKAETLVNFGGVSKAGPSGQASDDTNELILVTLLVASEGDLRLPQVFRSPSNPWHRGQAGCCCPLFRPIPPQPPGNPHPHVSCIPHFLSGGCYSDP